MLEQKITFDTFVRGILTVVGLAVGIYLLNYLSGVLLPFFVAWLLAYMLHPFVKFFQYKLHLRSRVLSILVTLLLLAGVITGIVMLIVPSIVEEFAKLRDIITVFFQNGTRNASIPMSVERFIKENVSQSQIVRILHQENVANALRELIPQLWNMVYQTVNVALSVVASLIVLLYMFFILKDYETISNGWIEFIPPKRRTFVATLAQDVERGMNSYFRGQALIALCVGILFSVGFLIIDFPMAIGLGLFIGLLNMVPYLQMIGFLPTVLLALLKAADTGQNFWMILLSAFIVFVVVQLIQDLILTPKIMGKIMGLNPAVILLSLSVWGCLLGFIGLIIALPLTTLMVSYYRRYVLKAEDYDTHADKEKPQK